MIKINLLAGDQKRARKKVGFQAGQKVTLGASLILLAAGLFIGWRYWTVTKESAALDTQIAAAQKETARLHSIITQVQQFEQRRAQLQQRVALIDQLRKEQTGPVHLLDQVSRALPSMVWLTDLKQIPNTSEVEIDGKCTNETEVADFVANLEGSGYFKKSIDINTTTEQAAQPSVELVKFTLRATFQPPGDPAKLAPGGAAAGAAKVTNGH
jgi:type IV pilus assembly protein PilN